MPNARVPWVVAVWRSPGGPGAGGGSPARETAHVFPSHAAFEEADRLARERGARGQWVKLFVGDPRPWTPDWKPGDFDYAPDSVIWYGNPSNLEDE